MGIFMDVTGILAILIVLESLVPLWYVCMKFLARKDKPCAKNFDYRPSISIVVPTYNEEATIEKKLQNILEQTYRGKMEVFVVDGRSDDATTSIVRQFMKSNSNLKVELIREETRGGITQAENLAFPKCSGDLVCVSDSDCIWEKDALAEAVANFFDNSVGAVTGSRSLLSTQNVAEKMEEQYNSFNETLRLGESALDSTPIFRGELAVFRKSLLNGMEVGTESFQADDSEMCMKIRKMGYRAIMDKKAVFYEFAPPSVRSRMRQKLTRGSGLMRLFLNNWSIIVNPKKYGWYSLIVASNLYMLLVSPILVLLILLFGIVFVPSLPMLYLLSTILVFVGLIVGQYYIGRNILWASMTSFLQSQFVLLLSLPLLFKKQKRTWTQVGAIREKWKHFKR
jgi:biofilm PGA synthesis N-glycosyltransferase PgaC